MSENDVWKEEENEEKKTVGNIVNEIEYEWETELTSYTLWVGRNIEHIAQIMPYSSGEATGTEVDVGIQEDIG